MSSSDDFRRYSDVKSWRRVKSGSRAKIMNHATSKKNYFPSWCSGGGGQSKQVRYRVFKEVWRATRWSCVRLRLWEALSVGYSIDFGDLARSAMFRTVQLFTLQPVYTQMFSLFLLTKFLTALVAGSESPTGAQLSCFYDEILKTSHW